MLEIIYETNHAMYSDFLFLFALSKARTGNILQRTQEICYKECKNIRMTRKMPFLLDKRGIDFHKCTRLSQIK